MKTLPFEGVLGPAAELPGDGGEQLVPRAHRPSCPVFMQHEAAGAVGVLGHARARCRAGRTARPAGRRRCRRSARRPRPSAACDRRRRPRSKRRTSGSMPRGTRSSCSSSSSHVAGVDVEEHRARGVARVGDVQRAAGQVPDEPGIDRCRRPARPPRPLARRRARCRASRRAWCRRSRRRAPARSCSRMSRLVRRRPAAGRRSPAVRRSCQTMALWIGSPVSRSQTTVVSRWLVMPMAAMSRGRQRRPGAAPPPPRRAATAQISCGVVLHPAGPGEDLPELLLGARPDRAVVVEHDGARARRPLVEGEDVGHLEPPPGFYRMSRRSKPEGGPGLSSPGCARRGRRVPRGSSNGPSLGRGPAPPSSCAGREDCEVPRAVAAAPPSPDRARPMASMIRSISRCSLRIAAVGPHVGGMPPSLSSNVGKRIFLSSGCDASTPP